MRRHAGGATSKDRLPLRVVGHRGAPRERIENTIASFEEALRQGADALECDVRASRDGVALLFHDRTLARLAGQEVSVEDLSLAEARRLTLRAPGRPAGRIAPLTSLLRLARRKGVPVAIEVKSPCGPRGVSRSARIARTARAVAAAVRETGTGGPRHILISFDLDVLEALRPARTGLRLGAIFDRPPSPAARRRTERMAALLVLQSGLLENPAVARWVVRTRLPVWVYAIDSRPAADRARTAARAFGARLEALISNCPGRLRSGLEATPSSHRREPEAP